MVLVKKLDNKFVFIAGRKDPTIGSAVVFNLETAVEQLIRIKCFADSGWVWSVSDWQFKGKELIFEGVVKANHQTEHIQ